MPNIDTWIKADNAAGCPDINRMMEPIRSKMVTRRTRAALAKGLTVRLSYDAVYVYDSAGNCLECIGTGPHEVEVARQILLTVNA